MFLQAGPGANSSRWCLGNLHRVDGKHVFLENFFQFRVRFWDFFRRRLGGQFSYWCIGAGCVTEKYREFYKELRNIENSIEKYIELDREMRNI